MDPHKAARTDRRGVDEMCMEREHHMHLSKSIDPASPIY